MVRAPPYGKQDVDDGVFDPVALDQHFIEYEREILLEKLQTPEAFLRLKRLPIEVILRNASIFNVMRALGPIGKCAVNAGDLKILRLCRHPNEIDPRETACLQLRFAFRGEFDENGVEHLLNEGEPCAAALFRHDRGKWDLFIGTVARPKGFVIRGDAHFWLFSEETWKVDGTEKVADIPKHAMRVLNVFGQVLIKPLAKLVVCIGSNDA